MVRATRYVTLKEGKWWNPFYKEYYFTSGRNIVDFYEKREKNNQLYDSLKHERRKFSKQETAKILKQREYIKAIDKYLKAYREMELEKASEKEKAGIRRQILDLVDRL